MHTGEPRTAASAPLDPVDARLIDRLQGELPVTERPFAEVGAELGLSEAAVIDRLRKLLAQGVLTRFGPLFQIERAGGQFLLAALEGPEADFQRITGIVNALPEVAHNYRREHKLNMWFVVGAESPAAVEQACRRIEQQTGLPVHRFPKEREFFVGLRLPASLDHPPEHGHGPV